MQDRLPAAGRGGALQGGRIFCIALLNVSNQDMVYSHGIFAESVRSPL